MRKVIHLSLTNRSVPVRFDVVQYATFPELEFICDDFEPFGIASFYVKKPSGEEIYNQCTIEGNSIIYTPTTQTFAEEGINECQLQLVQSNVVGVSFVMYAHVQKNIISSDAAESQSEFTQLQEALATVDQYDERIEELEDRTSPIQIIEESGGNRLRKWSNGSWSGTPQLSVREITFEDSNDADVGQIKEQNGFITMRVNNTNYVIVSQYATQLSSNDSVSIFAPETIVFGDLEVRQGYIRNIGEIANATPSAISMTSDARTNIASLELPKGRWLVFGTIQYAENATGRRELYISSSDRGSQVALTGKDIQNAVNGEVTLCQGMVVYNITGDDYVCYLNGYQNSGSNLSVTGRLHAIQLR